MSYRSIHALIGQASQLVQQLSKRENFHQLRQEANALTQELDKTYPKQSAIQQLWALVRQFAHSTDKDFSLLSDRAAHLDTDLELSEIAKHKQHQPSESTRRVDAWILDMFRATESAIPRESLLEEFVRRYREEKKLPDTEQNKGPWLFVFETRSLQNQKSGQNEIISIRGIDSAGVYPHAFKERCREHLSHWRDDPFLHQVFIEGKDIDGWYALLFGGSELFDSLLDTNRHMGGEPDYWLNAVFLPSDGRNEARAVCILYSNFGTVFYPEPPAGLRLDMRLLTVLGFAWRQLEHQVKNLARLSETDRRDMINLIAPGLLHHEIGFNMRTAYGQVYEQYDLLKRIAEETGRDDVLLAARYAQGIAHLVLKLYRITVAFNNLDKRTQVETISLEKIFSDIKLLLQHRLGSSFTDLTWDADVERQTLHTDAVLFSQALINLINNAINALEESNTPAPRHIQIRLIDADTKKLSLLITNNGPDIPAHLQQAIFKRGFTSRKQGHGQGLYLARLVAHYLGGELQLQSQSDLPQGFNMGFRFSLNRQLPDIEGVARNAE